MRKVAQLATGGVCYRATLISTRSKKSVSINSRKRIEKGVECQLKRLQRSDIVLRTARDGGPTEELPTLKFFIRVSGVLMDYVRNIREADLTSSLIASLL